MGTGYRTRLLVCLLEHCSGQRWSHPAVALRSPPAPRLCLDLASIAQHGLKVFPPGAVGSSVLVEKFIVDYRLDSTFV